MNSKFLSILISLTLSGNLLAGELTTAQIIEQHRTPPLGPPTSLTWSRPGGGTITISAPTPEAMQEARKIFEGLTPQQQSTLKSTSYPNGISIEVKAINF